MLSGSVVLLFVVRKGIPSPTLQDASVKITAAQTIKAATLLYIFILNTSDLFFNIIHYFYLRVNKRRLFANTNCGGERTVEKKKNNKKRKPELSPLVQSIVSDWEAGSETDVLGSYTGNPSETVRPQQDADDL